MAADFGRDIACNGDIDPFFNLVSGRQCLIEAILHRLSTPRGSLIDDPNYGLDVRAWLSAALTGTGAFALQVAIEGEVTKDERIRAADATVTFNATSRALRIVLALTTADGPFALTLDVTALTVGILSTSDPQ